MSEASRARRQRYLNIREELAWREQQLLESDEARQGWPGSGVPGFGLARQDQAWSGMDPSDEGDMPPSWGEIGSLARQLLTPKEYEHLMMLHNDMLQRARARTDAEAPGEAQDQPPPEETPKEPPAQNRVLARSEGPPVVKAASW